MHKICFVIGMSMCVIFVYPMNDSNPPSPRISPSSSLYKSSAIDNTDNNDTKPERMAVYGRAAGELRRYFCKGDDQMVQDKLYGMFKNNRGCEEMCAYLLSVGVPEEYVQFARTGKTECIRNSR